jgi:hypothetical protein
MLLIALFSMTALSQGWLDEGYVASSGSSTAAQYFTDPIFFTKVPQSQPLGFYSSYLINESYYPAHVMQPALYKDTMSALQWQPFSPNWSATLSYAKQKSSAKVYKDGAWQNL